MNLAKSIFSSTSVHYPPVSVFDQNNYRHTAENYYYIPYNDDMEMIFGNGSATNPFVIRARFDFPKRHMPFQVLFVPNVILDEYEFDIIDISLCIDLGGANSWEANVVFDKVSPEFHYHTILATGSSLGDFQRKTKKYHKSQNYSFREAVNSH
eukprot:3147216-Ditylum_brightwellii.AAC.1